MEIPDALNPNHAELYSDKEIADFAQRDSQKSGAAILQAMMLEANPGTIPNE